MAPTLKSIKRSLIVEADKTLSSAKSFCSLFPLFPKGQSHSNQGDQIGLLITLGSLKKVIVQSTWSLFYTVKSYVSYLTKNGLGWILGDFFHKLIWSL
jgi:hypothetical protein